jgi:dolichyl-phosphate-mannose-protein mannosyltransferase
VRLNQRILNTTLILFFASLVLFLINIQFPAGHNFDEFHYVPSAKQFLALSENQNWEHPPLGKMIMATGIALWGDRPIGWRFMSTVFGSLTLIGMYALGLVLFESEQAALWVALITLCNQLLYVQSRIGMLDTFMFGFLIWGLVAFCSTWTQKKTLRQQRSLLAFSGVMFGLAMACKWFAIVPWASCILMVAIVRVMQNWETFFAKPKESDWYQPQLWKHVHFKEWVVLLVIIPCVSYFFTFIPLLLSGDTKHSPLELFTMQYKMWDGQLRVVNSHPYMSRWTDWPLLKRPIWYAFEKDPSDPTAVRGVMLLGNPLMMWLGLVALFVNAYHWIRDRDKTSFLILFFYTIFIGSWILIPRKIAFYYYYYPAGMMLSFALANLFYNKEHPTIRVPWAKWALLGACFCLFIYFFPILSAVKIPAESFRRWMWFSSWI